LWVQGWADGLWSGVYRELRPINALAFMVDGRLWGLNPVGYHVTNLLLHAVCAMLVGLLAWRVTRGRTDGAVAATVLFALHPAQAGAVTWICGRVDLISTGFYLGALLALVRYRDEGTGGWRWLAALAGCFAGVLFTKEVGFTWPVMALAADRLWLQMAPRWREGRTWVPYGVGAGVLAVYLGCRYAAFGVAGPGGVGRGLPDGTAGRDWAEMAARQAKYLAHLFPPVQAWLRGWRDAGFARSAGELGWVIGLAGAGVTSVFLTARWLWREAGCEERRVVGFFGAGWYLVATGPLIVTYFSPRHLYLAVAGLVIALVVVLQGIGRSRVVFGVAALALAGLYAQQLAAALRPWRAAGEMSRAISEEVRQAGREAGPGSAVILDVPELVEGALGWGLAVPYAVQAPFIGGQEAGRVAVIERPGVYARQGEWRGQPAMAALERATAPSWIIRVDGTGTVRRRVVSEEKLREAARRMREEDRRTADETVWRRFLAAIETS
jgi:hypothetical protein